MGRGKWKYEEVVEEGRGFKVLSPRVLITNGARVPRTKISQSQNQIRA